MLTLCSLGSARCFGQTRLLEQGISAVEMAFEVSRETVLSTEKYRDLAILAGPGVQVSETLGKKSMTPIATLPGSEDLPVRVRILKAELLPRVEGPFTWLKTVEGSYVSLPVSKGFTVLVERKPKFPNNEHSFVTQSVALLVLGNGLFGPSSTGRSNTFHVSDFRR